MKNKIKVITSRDKELFKQLARTAVTTREQAQIYLNYDKDNKRLSNLVKDGYIKQEIAKIKSNYEIVYRLNNRGKNYLRDNIAEVDKLYKFASAEHDYRLTELYYKEFWDYRDTWRTEQDYKQDYQRGTPDATIKIGGITMIIEIITQNYTNEEIRAKEEFAENNGMEVNFYSA